MNIPRDLTGKDLIKLLNKLGYEPTRQVGSHIRLTTAQKGTHHLTIPNHKPLKVGTLSSIFERYRDTFQFIERGSLGVNIEIKIFNKLNSSLNIKETIHQGFLPKSS